MLHQIEAIYWRWRLNKKRFNRQRLFLPWNEVNQVGILAKANTFNELNYIQKVANNLISENKKIEILCLMPRVMSKKWVPQNNWEVITRHKLATTGFKDKTIQKFVSYKFDFLINLHNCHPELLAQISHYSSAKFRLGFQNVQHLNYADLIINLPQTSFDEKWLKALIYLKQINTQ